MFIWHRLETHSAWANMIAPGHVPCACLSEQCTQQSYDSILQRFFRDLLSDTIPVIIHASHAITATSCFFFELPLFPMVAGGDDDRWRGAVPHLPGDRPLVPPDHPLWPRLCLSQHHAAPNDSGKLTCFASSPP